jgi:hypothetical protein
MDPALGDINELAEILTLLRVGVHDCCPVAPVNPVNPVAPVNPVNPVAPVNPVKPVKPIGPIGPKTRFVICAFRL